MQAMGGDMALEGLMWYDTPSLLPDTVSNTSTWVLTDLKYPSDLHGTTQILNLGGIYKTRSMQSLTKNTVYCLL